MPGKRCSNCVTYNLECTYVEAAKVRYYRPQCRNRPPEMIFLQKRGPPKGYFVFLLINARCLCPLHRQLCRKPRKSTRKNGETPANRAELLIHPSMDSPLTLILF